MHHLSWNIQVPLDVKLFCARYEYLCHLKTYQSVFQHQIPSMISHFWFRKINLHWRGRNFSPGTAKSTRQIWKDRWDCWGQGKSWWDVNFNNGIYGPPCPTLLFHKTKPFLQMKFLEIENECKAKVWQRFANFKVIFLLSIMFGPQW